jgi:hypothetical protein
VMSALLGDFRHQRACLAPAENQKVH